MPRYAGDPLNIQNALGGNALIAVLPIGNVGLTYSQELSEGRLAAGFFNCAFKT